MNLPQPFKFVSESVQVLEGALQEVETGSVKRGGQYERHLPTWFVQVETSIETAYHSAVSHGTTIYLSQFMFPRGKHDLAAKKVEYLAGIEKTYQGLNARMSACKDRAQKLGIVVG